MMDVMDMEKMTEEVEMRMKESMDVAPCGCVAIEGSFVNYCTQHREA